MSIKHKPFLLIISSPSGAGKTSVSRLILQRFQDMHVSISVTTRLKRPNEEDKIDYYFVNNEEFSKLIKSDSFLEHATVYENSYGTLKENVQHLLENNYDVLFDIDYQGMMSIKEKMPKDVVTLYILPPSISELQNRLESRSSDSAAVIAKRISEAKKDIGFALLYDYIVINDDLNDTVEKITSIINAERIKRTDYNSKIQDMLHE